jgi:hypothetical protein
MESLTEALRLLQRQLALEEAMHSRGGIRVIDERELYQLRERLTRFPTAVGAILEASKRLKRRVDTLSVHDVSDDRP